MKTFSPASSEMSEWQTGSSNLISLKCSTLPCSSTLTGSLSLLASSTHSSTLLVKWSYAGGPSPGPFNRELPRRLFEVVTPMPQQDPLSKACQSFSDFFNPWNFPGHAEESGLGSRPPSLSNLNPRILSLTAGLVVCSQWTQGLGRRRWG